MAARTNSANSIAPYEQRLDADSRFAMAEGSGHFEGASAVQRALRNITGRLDALKIDYAIVDGMAMFSQGVRRFTEDVDILVTPEALQKILQDRGRTLKGPRRRARID